MRRRDLLRAAMGCVLAPLAMIRGQAPEVNITSHKRLWEAQEQERAEAERDSWLYMIRSSGPVVYDPGTRTYRMV